MPTDDRDGCEAGVAQTFERRKRLPEEDRRRLVLTAAQDVFCSKGFAATTMDDVAQAAGMSKKTLYTLFDSKMSLFRELMQVYRQRQEALLRPAVMDGTAEQQLNSYLEHIRTVVLSTEKLGLHRMIIREALIAPDLADLFMEVVIDPGPMGLVWLMEQLLGERASCGIDPKEAAEIMLGMAFGVPLHKLMISERYQLDDSEARRRIGNAVRIFVKGLGLDAVA